MITNENHTLQTGSINFIVVLHTPLCEHANRSNAKTREPNTNLQHHGNKGFDLQNLRGFLHDDVVVLEAKFHNLPAGQRRVGTGHRHNFSLLGQQKIGALSLGAKQLEWTITASMNTHTMNHGDDQQRNTGTCRGPTTSPLNLIQKVLQMTKASIGRRDVFCE
jgi:hypothetical protein